MFDARYLDILDETGWGWLPAVLILCHNAGRVAFAEGFVSESRVAEFSAACLERLVRLSSSEGPTRHELVGRETSVRRLKARKPQAPHWSLPGSTAKYRPQRSGLPCFGGSGGLFDQAWPLWQICLIVFHLLCRYLPLL